MAIKKKIKTVSKAIESPFKDYWDRNNYLILAGGILVVVLGFYLMSVSPWDNPISLSLSPIVLILAYIVIFPAAIFFRKRSKKNRES